jgi:hypothetical protein
MLVARLVAIVLSPLWSLQARKMAIQLWSSFQNTLDAPKFLLQVRHLIGLRAEPIQPNQSFIIWTLTLSHPLSLLALLLY